MVVNVKKPSLPKRNIILFPDGSIFHINAEMLLTEADFLSFKKIRNALIGAFILSENYDVYIISNVTLNNSKKNIYTKLLNIGVQFYIDLKLMNSEANRILAKFIKASMAKENSENIAINIPINDFSKIKSVEKFYEAIVVPDINNVLDKL